MATSCSLSWTTSTASPAATTLSNPLPDLWPSRPRWWQTPLPLPPSALRLPRQRGAALHLPHLRRLHPPPLPLARALPSMPTRFLRLLLLLPRLHSRRRCRPQCL